MDGLILQLADLALLSQMRGASISDVSYPIRRVLLAMLGVCKHILKESCYTEALSELRLRAFLV